MSGRYYFAPKPDDPNLTNFQAYFGTDQTRYPAQSPISGETDADLHRHLRVRQPRP